MAHGLLLAAGAGTRMGMPKALVRDDAGRPWLTRAVAVLLDGGCPQVTVVLGAAADEAQQLLARSEPGDELVDARVHVVRSRAWQSGMGASLRTGLRSLADAGTTTTAALVHLVDLPDVTAEVVARVLEHNTGDPAALARASYLGRPGHPVLIGRDHWAGVSDSAAGDRGARRYLSVRDPWLVECGDLASGRDVDEPTSDQRPAQ
ncbi:molybdenum cofactor cytidylyltransferase/nicotine blue oxidoreductase [Nocardioides sp. J9]|uniref:nucleotidyltransferase family protein n=1 Tax=Nocardioides sp. J9 TaxID=935844 RepID=UPI0011A3F6C8|nr:nucleotidyltransferase family protein [Nocardioides sp. J9]TWG91058.1 molybdenum cofactor cytidylyltransferase/nicotine blue oxidoreductase [Nocardioides sp. J9]